MFTLGVLTTTIYGALNQFFPGALGISIRSVRVAHWTWVLHTAGTLTLVTGFWVWRPALLGAGWLLLFAGVFGSSWNLLPQRRKAPRGLVVGRYVSAGHIALGTAMLVALARIGNSLGWWPLDRMAVVVSHFHLAVFGFVVFTAVGVGSWMLPMFLLAASAPTWPLRWIGPVGMSGLAILTAGALGAWPLADARRRNARPRQRAALPRAAGALLPARGAAADGPRHGARGRRRDALRAGGGRWGRRSWRATRPCGAGSPTACWPSWGG